LYAAKNYLDGLNGWAAISRPPYFSALAFAKVFPNFRFTYGFEEDGIIRVNADACPLELRRGSQRKFARRAALVKEDELPRHHRHLARRQRGWAYGPSTTGTTSTGVKWVKVNGPFEIQNKTWKLRLESSGEADRYSVVGPYMVSLREVGWADIDYRGRLVFAREGVICAADESGVKE